MSEDILFPVETKNDFIKLLNFLSTDLKNNRCEWENYDLASYLTAIAAWVDDMDGFYLNQNKPIPDNISWNVFADILMAARVYE